MIFSYFRIIEIRAIFYNSITFDLIRNRWYLNLIVNINVNESVYLNVNINMNLNVNVGTNVNVNVNERKWIWTWKWTWSWTQYFIVNARFGRECEREFERNYEGKGELIILWRTHDSNGNVFMNYERECERERQCNAKKRDSLKKNPIF